MKKFFLSLSFFSFLCRLSPAADSKERGKDKGKGKGRTKEGIKS
jgi:hypothetical protein